MEPKDFQFNPHIIEAFESQSFKIEPDFSQENDFKINITFPPFEDSNGPTSHVSCKEPECFNNLFSNEKFIKNFCSNSNLNWQINNILYNYIEKTLHNTAYKNKYKVLVDAVSYIPEIKEKFNIISSSLKEIETKEYPSITLEDMERAENRDKSFSNEICPYPVWSRILNDTKGLNIIIFSDNYFSIKGTSDIPFEMTKPFPFDGTIRGFLGSFHKLIEEPFPYIKQTDTMFSNILDAYNAMHNEALVISKEIHVSAEQRHVYCNDSWDSFGVNKFKNIANEADYLLGLKAELKLSSQVEDTLKRFVGSYSIYEKTNFTYELHFPIHDDYSAKLSQSFIFDGTDEGLLKCIQKRINSMKADPEKFEDIISRRFKILPKYVKSNVLPKVLSIISHLDKEIQEAIKSRDFHENFEARKNRVNNGPVNKEWIKASEELYKMQGQASKYGIYEQPIQLKTIDEIKPKKKKEKYEPTIFR